MHVQDGGKGSKPMKQDVHVTRRPIKAAANHLYSFSQVWLSIHLSFSVFPVFSPDFVLSFCFPHRNVYSLGLLNNKTEGQISGTVCCLSASAIPGDTVVNHTNSSALSSILF